MLSLPDIKLTGASKITQKQIPSNFVRFLSFVPNILFMLLAGPFVAIWGMGAFFWDKFDEKKGHFVCLHPINRCHVIFIILN